MELLTVSVTGYKRFRKRTNLQTNGKLVALLGPNEAGKSSLLHAISHLAHDEAMEPGEISRGLSAGDAAISGRFFLTAGELEAAGLTGPRTLEVTKTGLGARQITFNPPAPERDVSHRARFAKLAAEAAEHRRTQEMIHEFDEDLLPALSSLATSVEREGETLKSATLKTLSERRAEFEEAAGDAPTTQAANLLTAWKALLELERSPSPHERAVGALGSAVPAFLLFDEDARALASTYAISELRSEIPQALRNLAEVAELDFAALLAAVDAGQTAQVTTIEARASRTLATKFKAAWKQSGIEVAIRIQNDVLEVQIVDVNFAHTALAERSDGLRQFVALQMFATRRHVNAPVLLIDEADQRLHYDAQADLVQMLARQQVAPKVIYTTHSAGCLPEDLGNGVRTVVPNDEDGTSTVVNRFWQQRDKGFSPLLIGLGAATMAFFPTRRAVMVEGESDMLLYPSLLREALKCDVLGFQVVPGLSQQSDPRAVVAGQGVLYLVDGDDGGNAIAERLRGFGIPADDIFLMRNQKGSALELEDFVREDALLAAVNGMLSKWYPDKPPIETLTAPPKTRMEVLEEEFDKRIFPKNGKSQLQKPTLAYELLDRISAEPGTKLLDLRRLPAFKEIARQLLKRFDDK